MAKDYNYPTYDAGGRVKKKEISWKEEHTEMGTNKKGNYVSDRIISVPAETVGGKKGEKRYYRGKGERSSLSASRKKATLDAKTKASFSPADSLTTKDFQDIKNPPKKKFKLFKKKEKK